MQLEEIKPSRLSIEIAPLVDLVFLLLIFFMVGTQFTQPAMNIRLPEAISGSAQEKDRLVLYVLPGQKVVLNGQALAFSALKIRLKSELEKYPERSVTIRSDSAVSFGDFVRIMDCVRLAGAMDLKIEHRRGLH